jgi:hypothetical protein
MTALIKYSEKLSVSGCPGAWLVGLLYRVQADWGGMRNQVELVSVNGVVSVFELSCMFIACPANMGS